MAHFPAFIEYPVGQLPAPWASWQEAPEVPYHELDGADDYDPLTDLETWKQARLARLEAEGMRNVEVRSEKDEVKTKALRVLNSSFTIRHSSFIIPRLQGAW